MAIQFTNEIKKLDVIESQDGAANVIKRVVWEITFTDPEISTDVESKLMACSVLDTDGITSFLEIDDLTDNQILEWAYAKHGGADNFIPMVTPTHIAEIQRRAECFGLQEYNRELKKIVDSNPEYDGLL
tara:strand:+ start:2409 stop:2795 length:387 start_codon:yes stop_codon:yes gene_type:complete